MSPQTKNPLLTDGVVLNGKWEILEHIANGGKGEVYRARQTNLDRVVVVKTISLEFLGEFADDEEQIETEIERFHREAMAMAQVRHPYVVQVYDQDSDLLEKDGSEVTVQYLVMEYVPGETLRATMPEKGFGTNEQEALQWMRNYFLPILDGVEKIHELGIVHRDIKPENVLLDGPTPKITDFGIVGGVRWQELTRSHHVEGTISYMAPEQFMDLGETDVRGDIYALGKILYEVTTGRMTDSKTACPLKGVCLADPITPFLRRLDSVIQEATAEDKEQRTPSVEALRQALLKLVEDFDESKPLQKDASFKRSRRRQLAIGVGIGLCIIAVFLGSHLFHHFFMSPETPTTSEPLLRAPQDPTLKSAAKEISPFVSSNHTPVTLKGKDGCVLRLVPEGEIVIPEDFGSRSGQSIKVRPFYLYETPVSNRDFVEFLNQVLPKLRVEQGIVRSGEQIWLMLGEAVKGYEPIIFQDGRFSVKEPAFAFRPVVRVTAYGASAYAQHYGERLPTVLEWLRVLKKDRDAPGIPPFRESKEIELGEDPALLMEPPSDTDNLQAPLNGGKIVTPVKQQIASRLPTPGILYTPDEFGIRGLGKIIGEWGMRESDPSSRQTPDTKFVILGGLGSSEKGSKLTPVIERNPWEAFEEVGFRCALSIKSK